MKPNIKRSKAMKPNIICSRVHDGRAFSWDGNKGVIEVSTLGDKPFCDVYNDACDFGFGIQGKDRMIVFAVEKELTHDGELAGWELKSISEPGFRVTVFND